MGSNPEFEWVDLDFRAKISLLKSKRPVPIFGLSAMQTELSQLDNGMIGWLQYNKLLMTLEVIYGILGDQTDWKID